MTQRNDPNIAHEGFSPMAQSTGPISSSFLSKSAITLVKREPLMTQQTDTVRVALELLRKERTGCVLVMAGDVLSGIFTERDCVLKVIATYCDGTSEEPVSTFMTKDPITVAPDAPIAYALNLMSHGGFRHLPIVSDGIVLGLISVKDVVDGLVHSMVEDIDRI